MVYSRWCYAVEDVARFAQMSEFLRRHMREAVDSAVDTRVLTDTTDGLGSISEPPDPGAESDYDAYVGSVTGQVDGRRAAIPAEVRIVVGAKTFQHMAAEFRTNNSEVSAYDRLRLISGGVRVHSDIPAPSGNDQLAYSVAGPANLPGVAPMWDGIGQGPHRIPLGVVLELEHVLAHHQRFEVRPLAFPLRQTPVDFPGQPVDRFPDAD